MPSGTAVPNRSCRAREVSSSLAVARMRIRSPGAGVSATATAAAAAPTGGDEDPRRDDRTAKRARISVAWTPQLTADLLTALHEAYRPVKPTGFAEFVRAIDPHVFLEFEKRSGFPPAAAKRHLLDVLRSPAICSQADDAWCLPSVRRRNTTDYSWADFSNKALWRALLASCSAGSSDKLTASSSTPTLMDWASSPRWRAPSGEATTPSS